MCAIVSIYTCVLVCLACRAVTFLVVRVAVAGSYISGEVHSGTFTDI